MPSAVQVVFNADTAQFVASVDAGTGAVSKQAEAVALAKTRILEAGKAQLSAATEAGASEEALSRIRIKVATDAANVTENNATRTLAALDRIEDKTKRVSEELKNLSVVVPAPELSLTKMPEVFSPVQQDKSALFAAYKAERAAAMEAGASEVELAEITKRYSALRAQAVEKAELEIAAARKSSQAGIRQQYAAEIAQAEQAQIRSKLEATEVPMASTKQGFWSRLWYGTQSPQELVSEAERTASSLRKVAESSEAHGDDITNKQRASALLRGGGLRAGENFASQFELFNKVASITFPILGAAELAKDVWEGVNALHEMYETAEKLPEALDRGFGSLTLGMRASNDALDLTNAKLEAAHAKFEKKPENALKIAAMETRVEFDKLAASIANDSKAVNDLLAQNKLSGLYALMGKGSTASVDSSITAYMNDLQDLSNKASVASSNGDTSGAEYFRKQVEAKRASALTWAKSKLFVLDNPQYAGPDDDVLTGANNSANRSSVLGFQSVMLQQQHRDGSEKLNVLDTTQAAQDEKQRAAQEAAKQAQQARQEAARKAMEAQRKQWESQDDDRKDAGTDTPVIEVNTWAARVSALKVGSDQYVYAKHQLAEKLKALTAADAEAAKQANAAWQKSQRTQWDLEHDSWSAETNRTAADEAEYWAFRVLEADQGSDNYKQAYDKYSHAIEAAQKEAEEASKARSKASLETGQGKTAYAEATLAIQVQTGQISRQDAAFQQAIIHAEQYRQKMESLQAELNHEITKDPNSAATVNAQAAVDKADADRKVQVMQDAANAAAASWQGALKNANANWVQDAQDSAKQVSELYGQALNGLNQNLTDLATGDKSHFADYFKGLGKSVVGDGLKHIEAPILSSLGLGKADGSASNPFSVRVVGGTLGGGGSFTAGAAGAMGGIFGKSSSDSGDDGGLSGFASFAKSALSFIPGGSLFSGLFGGHRALGGGVKAGVTYDVGEMGREEFTPDQDGTITPNSKTGDGSAHYSIYMDGGVTSEQVHQQITSALAAVHPKVVRDSANAVAERMARRPRSSAS